jgi:hypothetical protein
MILGAKGLMELIKRARTTISSIMCCSVLYFGCRCMLFETFNLNTVNFFPYRMYYSKFELEKWSQAEHVLLQIREKVL